MNQALPRLTMRIVPFFYAGVKRRLGVFTPPEAPKGPMDGLLSGVLFPAPGQAMAKENALANLFAVFKHFAFEEYVSEFASVFPFDALILQNHCRLPLTISIFIRAPFRDW